MLINKILSLMLVSTMVVAQPYFTPVSSTGVPYIIIITNVDVSGTELATNSEIAVFDDTLCVGVGVFDGNYNYQFSAWQANQGQELPGFTIGAEMDFRVWTQYGGVWQEFEAIPTFEEGDGTFGNGLYAVLSLNVSVVGIGSGAATIQPSSFVLEAYPNPFNSEIRIPITLDEKSSAELTIMSLRGRELWSRDVKGSVQLSWKGLDQNGRALPTGTYLIVMQSETQQIVEQITLLK